MLLGFLEKGSRVLMIDRSYEISVLVVFIQNPEVMFEKCLNGNLFWDILGKYKNATYNTLYRKKF